MNVLVSLFNSLPGAAGQGLIWGIMAIGVYITYKILDVADLTVDGSLATGGAVAALCVSMGWNPWLAVLAAVLGPVLRLEPMEPEAWLEEYGQVMAVQRQELEQTRAETVGAVIEQSCAAYIADKAAELGAACTAQVTCASAGGEGWLPDRVTVRGTLTTAQRAALSRTIWTELGVPEAHQSFETEEESP